MPPLSPTVRNILFVNIALLILKPLFGDSFIDLLGFHNFVSSAFWPHQILTYMFVHVSFWHLFGNMLTLYFLGPMLEYTFGAKRFLQYYIFTGVGAALVYAAGSYYEMMQFPTDSEVYNQIANIPIVGAAGATFGLLIALAMYFPNAEMIIFPIPIPIKAKYLVSMYAIYELYSGLKNNASMGYLISIGGGLVGFLLIKYWIKK